jgi:hypothetical protein
MSAVAYRPGTVVEVTDQPGPISAPTDTDAWFVVGEAERGPVGSALLVQSMDVFETSYGQRVPTSVLYDSVETFLREGGARCYVSRAIGQNADTAEADFPDATAAPSLHVHAKSPGTWGNGLTIAVAVGVEVDTFTIAITQAGTQIDKSPDLATPADAQAWSAFSTLIDVQAVGTVIPAPLSADLAGGSDGDALADADWTTALEAFPIALGPGQVSMPGRTSAAAHRATVAHAASHNRTAILDAADTGSVSSLLAGVSTDRAGVDFDRYGGLFAPWVTIPGVAAGTVRQVPWSPIQAGIYARNEHLGVPVSQPGAGRQYGQSRTALALTQTYKDADRDALTKGGVNTARGDLGIIESYGSRTIVDSVKFPQWVELGQVRLIMAIFAQSDAIAQDHLFHVIDGRGHEIAAFNGELTSMLIPYFEDGSLYGETPQEAFRVDTGPAVNTPATIADRQLKAVIGLRCSHMAELVWITIVKVETTQAL